MTQVCQMSEQRASSGVTGQLLPGDLGTGIFDSISQRHKTHALQPSKSHSLESILKNTHMCAQVRGGMCKALP